MWEQAKHKTPGHRGKRHLSSALVTNTRTEDQERDGACFFLLRFKLFVKKGSYCELFHSCSCCLTPVQMVHLSKFRGKMLTRPGCSLVLWPAVRHGCMFLSLESKLLQSSERLPVLPIQLQGSIPRSTVFLSK